ncbi:MAG: hypothetical protein SFV17_28280 [Candidatus Obscuribacter sp.]|nr:hypothetical protein [Candidatus Melainabacteria bacterium]MDX1990625.1 hypothetical protein [Candidatus Obscuribacter sp.]
MKIFTLTNKGTLFAGATLPLQRTNEGQYYIRGQLKAGPAVAIDLLLSPDAQIIGADFPRGAELIIRQASVEENSEGHYRLTTERPLTVAQNADGHFLQVLPDSPESRPDSVLVWIPDLKEEIEVNQGRVVGGVSKVLEKNAGESIQGIGSGGLVRMKPHSSFILATYHNLTAQENKPRQLSSVAVRYDGNGHFSVAGQFVPDYNLVWS